MDEPRFIVGIDLGTTNSAVAFVDTALSSAAIQVFPIPQFTATGVVEEKEQLPSFHFEPVKAQQTESMLDLPWGMPKHNAVIGQLARDYGAGQPNRLVVSAKSWLSHSGVDRKTAILPWHGASDCTRVSPCEVSARFLAHIRQAWDHARPRFPLAKQDIVLTVPASFDEVARQLTIDAAREAGLPKIRLMEEPQAAFYHWMENHARDAEGQQLVAGDVLLVCDIGGGTTDLTLIEVEQHEAEGVRFRRTAVGEHLILGGDNLDLALAHWIETQLNPQESFSPDEWSMIVRRCREAKELLLGDDPPEAYRLSWSPKGSNLIAGSRSVTLNREEAVSLLVDGFLPSVSFSSEPEQHRSGFQEFGLPYAPDPAITKWIARFLRQHACDEDGKVVCPKYVLLNGGFFAASVFKEQLLSVFKAWFGKEPKLLSNERLVVAVARGAARFALSKRGEGPTVAAGLAHGYYLKLDEHKALCLLPAGLEEGETVHLDEHTFQLRIREPVSFPLLTSSLRTTDKAGSLMVVDPDEFREMPPVKTIIKSGKKKKEADRVPVQLRTQLTPLGTIALWCDEQGGGQRSWQLQFDVRSAVQTERMGKSEQTSVAETLEEDVLALTQEVIEKAFSVSEKEAPNNVLGALEEVLERPRQEWGYPLLRSLWESTMSWEDARKMQPEYEAYWLNLLGFCLRPGFGHTLDDWRVSRVWALTHQGLFFPGNEMCRAEWWILWRRLAGGLSAGQQQTLSSGLLKAWKTFLHNGKKNSHPLFRFGHHEAAETLRLLGSLERLETRQKETLGNLILKPLKEYGPDRWNGAGVWALGRIGARQPVYGGLNHVLPADMVTPWIHELLRWDYGRQIPFALMMLTRKTGDRFRDVSEETRALVLTHLQDLGADDHVLRLTAEGGTLASEEQQQAFGESLPPGLELI